MPQSENSLAHLIAALPPSLPLLAHASGCITADELLARAEAQRAAASSGPDDVIRLRSDDTIGFITSLVAWDGQVHTLQLLPSDVATPPDTEAPSAAGAGATAWFLFTSGTTGTPKAIPHNLATLTQTTKHHVPGAPAHRWGLAYDPARFAGLQVVLQALLGGSELVAGVAGDFKATAATFVEHRIDALSATPTYWRKLLMDRRILACPLRHITLGGEIADQAILDALAKAFPEARIRHIYASTEAGVGFSVSDGRAGFPADYLSAGWAGARLRVDSDGALWIRPAQALEACATRETNDHGFINTHDRVEARQGRYLFVGRDSGIINVGGNKVFPEEVEQVLREVAGVCEARVSPQASSIAGQLVLAEIIAEPGVDRAELRRTILAHCRRRLTRHKVPAMVKWLDRIDMTQSGKILRDGRHA